MCLVASATFGGASYCSNALFIEICLQNLADCMCQQASNCLLRCVLKECSTLSKAMLQMQRTGIRWSAPTQSDASRLCREALAGAMCTRVEHILTSCRAEIIHLPLCIMPEKQAPLTEHAMHPIRVGACIHAGACEIRCNDCFWMQLTMSSLNDCMGMR